MTPSIHRRGDVIESAKNPLASRLRRLESSRAARERAGLYIAWGLHLGNEALAAGAPIREALTGMTLERRPEGRALLRALRQRGIEPVRAADRVLESVAAGSADQGLILVIERPAREPWAVLRHGITLALATHGVQDPGNLGSILRTAWALGADLVIVLEGCADPFGGRAVRAAMGAHFRLPLVEGSAAAVLPALRAAGLQIVAAHARGGERPDRLDLSRPVALLVGSEGGGLPEAMVRGADRRASVPLAREAESLNVHAAAAALLYEAARQRGFGAPRPGHDPPPRG